MNGTIRFALVLALSWLARGVHAQDLTSIVAEGSYRVLGGETITNTATLPAGWSPINDRVTFVYDPQFHFFMRGYVTDPRADRRPEFASYAYVVVAAAGDPGGNYQTAPSWITHEGFNATSAGGQATVTYRYGATYVPTMRGYQSFVIYANLEKSDPAASLFVYDDALTFGGGNYLLTGDGPEQGVSLQLASSDAAQGARGIEVTSERDLPGSHWKLMLFAHGSAAAFAGVDLRPYKKLVFYARANRAVTLQGGFGTGDDSGAIQFGALALSTVYQRFEVDLTAIDRSDINTLLWVYLHRSLNPGDFTGLSVHIDGVELVADVTSGDATIVVDRGDDAAHGACTTDGKSHGSCTLRAALALTQQVKGEALVQLAVDAQPTLAPIAVPRGPRAIRVTSLGGARTITGTGTTRLFDVAAGAALTLADVTIRGFASYDGGAIHNEGALVLDGTVVADNTARCSGVGAMTSYVSCFGGAVENLGTLTLRGGARFERNVVLASSSTASFTNAIAGGGAIVNGGELVVDGPVTFLDNIADASATSGYHGSMPGGATASASGGAIANGGTLRFTGAPGSCAFTSNEAQATASASQPSHAATASSAGGAIVNTGTLVLPQGVCSFAGNVAAKSPDVSN